MRGVSSLLAACWEAWTTSVNMHMTRAGNRCPLRPLWGGLNSSIQHVVPEEMVHQRQTCLPLLYLEFMLKGYETKCSTTLWSCFLKSSRCRILPKTRPQDVQVVMHCCKCTPKCLLRCLSPLLSHQPSKSVCITFCYILDSSWQLWAGSDQARFKFAKDAIELRKRGIARGFGAEETVVLAFGGGNFGSSAVHVTRKMRKRPLWKVNS